MKEVSDLHLHTLLTLIPYCPSSPWLLLREGVREGRGGKRREGKEKGREAKGREGRGGERREGREDGREDEEKGGKCLCVLARRGGW